MKKSQKPDFAYHLSKFLSVYLPGQRNVSSNTVLSYRDTFKLFLLFCKQKENLLPERLTLDDFSREMVEDFLQWLKEERGNGETTCNQRLGAVHSFFVYLQYEAPERMALCHEILGIKTRKAPGAPLNYLTVEGVRAILSKPDVATRSGRRDVTLLSLMYDTGARVQELADLSVSDIRFVTPATVRIFGKGRKARIVPLLSGTEKLLQAYLKDLKLNPSDTDHPLFCNRAGQQITRAGITYILKKYADEVQKTEPALIPENLSPHCMRHSKAMHLLQADVNLIYIRDLLGHSDVKTTEIYARADNTQKRKALEAANPIKMDVQFPAWTEDDGLMEWLQTFGK